MMGTKNRGLSIYELSFIILGLMILIILAYYGLRNTNPPASSFLTVPQTANQNYLSTSTPSPPTITTKADLAKALDAINETNVSLNSTDNTVLGNEISSF